MENKKIGGLTEDEHRKLAELFAKKWIELERQVVRDLKIGRAHV